MRQVHPLEGGQQVPEFIDEDVHERPPFRVDFAELDQELLGRELADQVLLELGLPLEGAFEADQVVDDGGDEGDQQDTEGDSPHQMVVLGLRELHTHGDVVAQVECEPADARDKLSRVLPADLLADADDALLDVGQVVDGLAQPEQPPAREYLFVDDEVFFGSFPLLPLVHPAHQQCRVLGALQELVAGVRVQLVHRRQQLLRLLQPFERLPWHV